MIYNKHSHLEGSHAFLSASNHHWVNYDLQKLEARYRTAQAAQRGTDLHDAANRCIRLGIPLRDEPTTMSLYVNDAIEYGMTSELLLFYSKNCFGTADALGYKNRFLRIHDLKTGYTHTSERQLYIYAALFCLEYEVDPFEIETELRIYQNDEIRIYSAEPETIKYIMDKIIDFDKRIEAWRQEDE